MKNLILLAAIMVMVSSAHAEIYQWTDRDGGVHFTDDMDNIPPSYRSKAREMDVTPMIESSEPAPDTSTQSEQGSPNLYGGHDEEWWRSSFKSIRDEIKGIEEKLPEKRERLTELRRLRTIYTRARDRVSYNDLDDEIKKDEQRVIDLKKRLADLDDEATRAGVPLGWR